MVLTESQNKGPNYTYRLRRGSDNKLHSSLKNASNLKRCHDPNGLRTHLEPNTPDLDLDVEENQEED